MSLRDIFCQDRAIGILQRGLAADRAAHACIFAGLDGVGKYKTAREWAKLLLCLDPRISQGEPVPFADSCGSCESCTLLEADSHPDYAHVYKELREYTRDGRNRKAPLDLPVDVIREFLIERVSMRPTLSARKVYVVSEAEKLNAHSQNALLKVLEEPPPYCTIILLCTRLERLLPTTKSRCQIIRFGPVEEERVTSQLMQMGVGVDRAPFFARLAQGSLGLACQWAGLESEGAELFQTKREAVASLADCGLSDALDLAGTLLERAKRIASVWAGLDRTTSRRDLNRRAQKTLVQMVVAAMQDVAVHHVAPGRPLVNSDQAGEIARLADRFGPERAIEVVADGYEMLRWIESNVNERLIFERLLLRLTRTAIISASD